MNEQKDYTISHTTTRKQEAYMIRFDEKEFLVKIKDCKKHWKEYDEITEVEIIQSTNMEDRRKINEILKEIWREEE